jgi:hypothetical protein
MSTNIKGAYTNRGLNLRQLYSLGSKQKRNTKGQNTSLMNLHNALERWSRSGSHVISVRSVNKNNHNNLIQKHTKAIGRSLQPKTNYKTQYLYRGISTPRANIRNTTGFTSWTNNPTVARENFARKSGSVLRINTSKLAGVPVLWLGNREGEYILPPMKITMANTQNNIIPVVNVLVNQNSMARLRR